MEKSKQATMQSVHFRLGLSAVVALYVGAICGCAVGSDEVRVPDVPTASAPADEKNTQERMVTERYSAIFWGTFEIQLKTDGPTPRSIPRLVDCHFIAGQPRKTHPMPLLRGSGHLRGFRGPPFRYVVGRRYMVFMAADSTSSGAGSLPVRAFLKIIDLDETPAEAAAIRRFAQPRERALPKRAKGELEITALERWFGGLMSGIAERTTRASDIVEVLGQPDELDVRRAKDGRPVTTIAFVLEDRELAMLRRGPLHMETVHPRLVFDIRRGVVIRAEMGEVLGYVHLDPRPPPALPEFPEKLRHPGASRRRPE